MNCEQARELIGADPETTPPELLEHLATCSECKAYREQMVAFNAKIRRALELDFAPRQPASGTGLPPALVDPRSNVVPLPLRENLPALRRTRPRGLPIAASLAAGLLIACTLWLSRPAPSLAAEVVTHVEGEPNSWARTQPVSAVQLEAVLRKSGVKLGSGMDPVVYANSCWFRGHFVPHFVVMTNAGPVTVMILVNEHISAPQQFSEDGYSGMLVPARSGGIAVVSRTPIGLEQPAAQVVRALQSVKD